MRAIEIRSLAESLVAIAVLPAPGAPETRMRVGFCIVPPVYQTSEGLAATERTGPDVLSSCDDGGEGGIRP